MVKKRPRSYKLPTTTCHGPCLSEHKETEGECLELVLNQMQRLDLLLAASHYCIDCHTSPTPPFISLVIRIAQEQGQFWSSSQLKMEAFWHTSGLQKPQTFWIFCTAENTETIKFALCVEITLSQFFLLYSVFP